MLMELSLSDFTHSTSASDYQLIVNGEKIGNGYSTIDNHALVYGIGKEGSSSGTNTLTVTSTKKFDVTNSTHIYIKGVADAFWQNVSTTYCNLVLTNGTISRTIFSFYPSNHNARNTQNITDMVDITDLTGEYYLKMTATRYGNWWMHAGIDKLILLDLGDVID